MVVVLMWRRRADAGAVDADQTDVVVLGVDPGLGRDLPAGAGSSVQPEHRAPPRGAELGEADLAVVADGDVSFKLGAGNRDGHAEQLCTCAPGYKRPSKPLGVQHPLADDPLVPQGGQLVVGKAEAAQDLVVVLTERGRGRAVVPGRPGGDAKRPAGIAVRPGDRMLELLVEPARVELGDRRTSGRR